MTNKFVYLDFLIDVENVAGELKENEEKFFYEVELKKKGIPGCIKWSNKPDLNGYTYGVQAHTVVINIFTSDDGRPKIAQCIQDLAKGTIPCRRNSEEYTAHELDEVLSTVYPSIPNPEVILYTGTLCCTHGLIPWQIRLAEFIQVSLDYSVNIKGFLGALCKYSKCDQRFGK